MMQSTDIEAELLRSVLDIAAHDVGSISSALALHVDVLQRDPQGASIDAMAALASELRRLGRQLREMRGPSGAGQLAPSRAGALASVHERVLRFGRNLLGRGTTLQGATADGRLSDIDAHALTLLLLAVMRHANDTTPATRRTVNLDIAVENDVAIVTLGISDASGPLRLGAHDSRWWQWAVQRATAMHFRMGERTDGVLSVTAPLDATAS
jgi:hypothetical protein